MEIRLTRGGTSLNDNNLPKLPSPEVYSQGDPGNGNPIKRFIKRLGRKLTFWYVDPFGERQNAFNSDVAQAIDILSDSKASDQALNSAIEKEHSFAESNFNRLSSRLDTSLDSVMRQLTQLNARLGCEEKLRAEADSAASASMDRFARRALPEARASVPFFDCLELGRDFTNSVTKELNELPESEIDPALWCEKYTKAVKQELVRGRRSASSRTIAVVCKRFMRCMEMEAVRNEALDLYKLLREKSIYNVKFISIEPDLTEICDHGKAVCIPEKGAGAYLAGLDPILCVFCESTPHILLSDGCSMILRRSVMKLSSRNPLQELSANTVAELNHLNDFGLHTYLVQSKSAAEILLENGFREPVVSYPIISGAKLLPRSRIFNKSRYTVGFASSPMEDAQADARGIGLLVEAASLCREISFEILWRYEQAEAPKELSLLDNCSVIYGKYNMTKFYSEIDCLLIPYKSINYNHACSLSAVEAMLNGIPVVSTDVSGVSEVVSGCGIGEVCAPDGNSIAEAIRRVSENYSVYLSPVNKQRLDNIIDNYDIVSIIESEAEKQLSARPITLYEWDRRLKSKDKYLVKGHQAMKEYYQQQEVADKYTEVRFTSKALKYFDMLERCNIGIILDCFSGGSVPQILDVACGDGRITSECIKHGKCTSIDASPAMLGIVGSRFEGDENKPETRICDVITDNIEGSYDAVTCFRYVRHFEYRTRRLIYKKFADCLRGGGLLIMDIPNIDFELRLKEVTGWENYNIYDVFWTKEGFIRELESSGFSVKYMIPTGEGLMTNMPEDMRKMPMTWTIGAVKKPLSGEN